MLSWSMLIGSPVDVEYGSNDDDDDDDDDNDDDGGGFDIGPLLN